MPHPMFKPDQAEGETSATASLRAFKRSMMLHRRLMASLLAQDATHPAQAGCLHALAHADGMRQSDLAEVLLVSRPTVTTMMQRMETAGLVERRADTDDARVMRVHLTPEGRARAARMREIVLEVLELSLGSLSETDQAELTRLLEAVNANMAVALAERGADVLRHCGLDHMGGDAR